jgi:hypothetical protein
MATQKLDRSEWQPFLDALSQLLLGQQAEIEVDSLALGSQLEADWLPLIGITYDPKDDLIEVALEGVDHMIPKPKEVVVKTGAKGIDSVEIVRDDNTIEIVLFREPLMLPSPVGS